jgi:hypothetical protein
LKRAALLSGPGTRLDAFKLNCIMQNIRIAETGRREERFRT